MLEDEEYKQNVSRFKKVFILSEGEVESRWQS